MQSCILIITLLLLLVGIYLASGSESFYIEPNQVYGALSPQSGMDIVTGEDNHYTAPLELEGPGIAAWSGY